MAFQMAIENSFIDMWKNSKISTIGENVCFFIIFQIY